MKYIYQHFVFSGAEAVPVIEECICTHGCYRMALMEQVYDYSDSSTPQIKVIMKRKF